MYNGKPRVVGCGVLRASGGGFFLLALAIDKVWWGPSGSGIGGSKKRDPA